MTHNLKYFSFFVQKYFSFLIKNISDRCPSLACPLLQVKGAGAGRDGDYEVMANPAPWALHRPIYKHHSSNTSVQTSHSDSRSSFRCYSALYYIFGGISYLLCLMFDDWCLMIDVETDDNEDCDRYLYWSSKANSGWCFGTSRSSEAQAFCSQGQYPIIDNVWLFLNTLYWSSCTVHSVLYTLYSSHCTVHSVLFTLYCTLCRTERSEWGVWAVAGEMERWQGVGELHCRWENFVRWDSCRRPCSDGLRDILLTSGSWLTQVTHISKKLK